MKPQTKKVMVFIVEGYSDKVTLEQIFKRIYKNHGIYFTFTRGDITSNNLNLKKDISEMIYQLIKDTIDDQRIKIGDVIQIVHIFDTDGVFIPNSAIIKGETHEFKYTTTNISCDQPQKIIDRNALKRKLLNTLLQFNEDHIHNIPYTCYFVSSNLEHALYNIQEHLDDETKQELSDAFYERFKGHEVDFIKFLDDEVVNGTPQTMLTSWKFIKQDFHSLERHTNLNIFFKNNYHDASKL